MEKESFRHLIETSDLVLVDFYATWCGPCKAMHPILEELKRKLGDRIRIAKIDVDKQQHLAAYYQIQSVPTLILFKKGAIKWRQSGAMPLHELLHRIESV